MNVDPNANPSGQASEATQANPAKFQIASAKLVPVVIFSVNDRVKLLENIKQGFKSTVS